MELGMVDRFRGCLLGLATGDALGTTLEFKAPGSFTPISDMVGGGPFRLQPGYWTDDTSMALCLAQSLIDKQDFEPRDQLDKYVRWSREGYMSSLDRCFDIGSTVSSALGRCLETGEPFPGGTGEYTAANGSIMRLAPVPMYYLWDPLQAMQRCGESSRTTHALTICVDACRFMGGLLVGAMLGESKEKLLAPLYAPVPGYWQDNPPHPEIEAVAAGSYKVKEPPEIKGSGYVVRSLEAALWAFHRHDDFRQGALAAVNLGNDADTTGAVFGQIAGAHYGQDGIPQDWLRTLAKRDLLDSALDGLWRQVEPRLGARPPVEK